MINIYESSGLVQLAELFRKKRKQQTARNPLVPEQIIVQNNEINRWLTRYLAEKDGIAANLDFKFPAEFFWTTIHKMDPDIPDHLPSDRGPMAWSIFQLLQSDNDSNLSVLHQYIHHQESHIREMRRWGLANRISDVFDQYLLYRPDMLLAWENEHLVTEQNSELWQAHLWRKVVNQWQDKGQMYRAKLQQKFFAAVENSSFPVQKLPQRITIFGNINVPPSFFKVISYLGKMMDIDFYHQNMAVNDDHLLVKSFNQKSRELETTLNAALTESNVSFERERFSGERQEQRGASSFHFLKNDLQFGSGDNRLVSTDTSFQIHSCHSSRREVEVLYDQLLSLMDEDESLNPSDINIVCPQIDQYTADIEAVFGAPEKDVPEIPFHISNVPAGSDSIESGFKKILKVVDSRFKMTEVIDLLECEPVRDKLELSQESLSTLTQWINQNRVRWGIDGNQKSSLGLPGTKTYTWQSGLHRMMAGYSMEAVDDSLFQGIYPYEEIDQSEHGMLLGKLSQFMHQLFECHKQVQEPKTPEEWHKLLRQWLSGFFAESSSKYGQRNRIMRVIDSLKEETSLAGWEGNISFQIVSNYLEKALQAQPVRGRRSGRGVTFSSMIAKHGIPAKINGIIGMNDGEFPRSKTTPDFDLIAQKPRKGDRSPAKDDPQLFLDYLLTATQGVYFSFVGQSNRTDAEYPPSAVLQEVIDYIVGHYSITEDELIVEHHLQPFSPHYFKNNEKKLFSYSQRNKKISKQIVNPDTNESAFLVEPLPEPEESLKKITLPDFIAFFQHPAKYLLQRRLGIYLRDEDFPDENRESFELSALDKSHFDRELGNRSLNNQSLQSYFEVARSQNLLPDGWPGWQIYDNQLQRVESFTEYIESKMKDDLLDPFEVDYRWNNFRIVGNLDCVYPNKQLLYRFGKMRPKDLLELWIKHLLLQLEKTDDHSGESWLVTHEEENDKTKAYSFKLHPPSEPDEILNNLVDFYQTGLRNNTMFFPKTSYTYAESLLRKNKNEQKALQKAQRAWHNPHLSFPQEGDDPYNNCLMKDIKPMGSNEISSYFEKVSKFIWNPVFQVLEINKENI